MVDRIRHFDDPRFGRVRVQPGDVWTVTAEEAVLRFDIREREGLTGPEGRGRAGRGLPLLRRRSFDVQAELAGRRYELHHTGARRSELRRDDTVVARMTGREETLRLPEHRPYDYDPVAWEPGADATDARVGHLLASCFGVGARGGVRRVGGYVSDRIEQMADQPVASTGSAPPFRSTDSVWEPLPEEPDEPG